MSKVWICNKQCCNRYRPAAAAKGLSVGAVELAKPGEYLVFRNARTDMFRGSMRLAVNQWGQVEAAEPNQDFEVKVNPKLIGFVKVKLMLHHVGRSEFEGNIYLRIFAGGGQYVSH